MIREGKVFCDTCDRRLEDGEGRFQKLIDYDQSYDVCVNCMNFDKEAKGRFYKKE